MANHENNPQSQPGIPVIAGETLAALMSQYTDRNGVSQSWGERLEAMQDKVVSTNPNLVKFMEMQVGRLPQALHDSMFEIIVGTLVLIERQAEVDAMNATFPDMGPEE